MQRVKVPDKVMTYITRLRQRYFILVVGIIRIWSRHIIHRFILVVDIIFIVHTTS